MNAPIPHAAIGRLERARASLIQHSLNAAECLARGAAIPDATRDALIRSASDYHVAHSQFFGVFTPRAVRP
jgi:hypothetical protein